jgi:hypothetical protein
VNFEDFVWIRYDDDDDDDGDDDDDDDNNNVFTTQNQKIRTNLVFADCSAT